MLMIAGYAPSEACTWCGRQEECLTMSVEDSAFLDNRPMCFQCFGNTVRLLMAHRTGPAPDARPGKRGRRPGDRARTAVGLAEAPPAAAGALFQGTVDVESAGMAVSRATGIIHPSHEDGATMPQPPFPRPREDSET